MLTGIQRLDLVHCIGWDSKGERKTVHFFGSLSVDPNLKEAQWGGIWRVLAKWLLRLSLPLLSITNALLVSLLPLSHHTASFSSCCRCCLQARRLCACAFQWVSCKKMTRLSSSKSSGLCDGVSRSGGTVSLWIMWLWRVFTLKGKSSVGCFLVFFKHPLSSNTGKKCSSSPNPGHGLEIPAQGGQCFF